MCSDEEGGTEGDEDQLQEDEEVEDLVHRVVLQQSHKMESEWISIFRKHRDKLEEVHKKEVENIKNLHKEEMSKQKEQYENKIKELEAKIKELEADNKKQQQLTEIEENNKKLQEQHQIDQNRLKELEDIQRSYELLQKKCEELQEANNTFLTTLSILTKKLNEVIAWSEVLLNILSLKGHERWCDTKLGDI